MRTVKTLVAAACSLVATGLMFPALANAGQGGTSDLATAPRAVLVETGMERVGFDADIARANGYEVRTAPDGRQYGVRPGENETFGFAEVFGDCGSSYISYEGRGGGTTETITGFEVRDVVAAGEWEVDIVDQGGVRVIPFDVTPGQTFWDGFSLQTNQTLGSSSAEVDPDFSQVVLVDGAICVSGGPATFTNIY